MAATAGAFGYMGWYATRVTLGKQKAGAPDFQAAPAQRIAPLAELQDEWVDVNFSYAGRPCTLLRVPQAVEGGLELKEGGHLVAYSRVCTHLGCTVNLVRDPEVLAFAFNYRPPREAQHSAPG